MRTLERIHIGRRTLLKAGVAVCASALFPTSLLAGRRGYFKEKRLAFYNLHTGETLKCPYYREGRYLPDALEKINYLLRDHRSGDIKSIDRGLLDLLFRLSRKLRTGSPFHVISGYRSPATNAMLRRNGSGVSKNSLHMQGQAIDIRLSDVDLGVLRKAAVRLKAGGVGFYPRSNFVHVDVGPVRYWS